MQNTPRLSKKITGLIVFAAVLVLTLLFGSSPYLFTSLFPTNTGTSQTADLYIPQNYQASSGQTGEVEVKIGKSLAKVAGIQLVVSYPADQISIFDASNTGLATSGFLIVKNTNDPGRIQIAMAQATGIDIAPNTTVLKLNVEVKSSVTSGSQIPLTIATTTIADQNGTTLPVTSQNGKITVSGGSLPGSDAFIQSITPDFALKGQETSIVIKGRNLPSSVQEVRVCNTALTAVTVNSSEISGRVPATAPSGICSISVLGSNGQRIDKEGAFTILDQAEGLSVDEKASYFSPARVKNDNTMTTTLWVKIDDLRGVEDLEYVDANLAPIGGAASNRMTANRIVDKSQWFVLPDIKIPNTVATSSTPYQVTVTATNRIGKVAAGKINIIVVNDVQTGVLPLVRQGYTISPAVPNNGKTTFTLYTYVTNDDGADKIGKVVADLSVVGDSVKTMTKDGEAVGNGFWFKAEGATVNPQIAEGSYIATITASNVTGETANGTVSIRVSNDVNAPRILSESYVSPNRVPPDNTTTFSVFALVEDQDGDDDIGKVTASFGQLGIAPKELSKGAAAGRGSWYELKDIKVPTTTGQGKYRITLTVTDKQSNTGERDLEIEVVSPDLVKNAPLVDSNRSYSSPATVANDGKTQVCSYAFITDPDGPADIVQANLDLRELGNSPVNKMEEDRTEGKGKWFKFCGNIPPLVAPSSAPYELLITATDKSGAVAAGKILLRVVDTNPSGVTAPAIEAATAIAADKLEVRFSAPLNADTVQTSGANFQIFDRGDISRRLLVSGATLTTSSYIVVLTTATQEADKAYTVKVDTRIKDQNGNSLRSGFGDQSNFRGFKFDSRAPEVKLTDTPNSTTVELEFWRCVKSSSVSPDGSDFRVFDVANSRRELEVISSGFKNENTIVLKTEEQTSGLNYGITIKNVQSCSGTPVGALGIEVFFKGFINALRSDLDKNGRVDFADFTIFSFDYGCFRGYSDCKGAPPQENKNVNSAGSNQNNTNSNPILNANRNS